MSATDIVAARTCATSSTKSAGAAQRVCEASGGDTEHWLAVVSLNDASRSTTATTYASTAQLSNPALPMSSGRTSCATASPIAGHGLVAAFQVHTRRRDGPCAGRPFLVEIVDQRPLPTVEVTGPVEARCWMSCTHWW